MSIHTRKLRIGITQGDIGGIGPELILKAFQDQRLKDICSPILYGSAKTLNIYRKILKINKFNYHIINKAGGAIPGRMNVIDVMPNLDRVEIGQPSESGARCAYVAVKKAIEDAMHQELDALVTLPVDKSTFEKHSPEFKGHTEMLAKFFGVEENLMLMVSEELRIGTATNHLAIKEVSRNISTAGIIKKIEILHGCLRTDFSLQRPKIAILGLNPHAGDNGLIGEEETKVILPAIQHLRDKGMIAEGPYPADGFFGNLTYKKFDAVLAMYHDQGLVPFKLLAGFNGVNYTAGMPFIRTSPDHGVAYDIAGKDLADPESLRQALYLAIDIFRSRNENLDLQANALKPSTMLAHDHGDEDTASEDLLLEADEDFIELEDEN